MEEDLYTTPPEMQDIYDKDTEEHKEHDQDMQDAQGDPGKIIDAVKRRIKNAMRPVSATGLEIGGSYYMDLASKGLLTPQAIAASGGWSVPIYGAVNFTSGALTNYAAQRLRGEEEISWGELIEAGLLDIIPFFGQKLKGAKGLTNIGLQSAARGVAGRQSRQAVDERQWLTPRQTLESALVGGAFGTMFKGISQSQAYWKAKYKKFDLLEADRMFGENITQLLVKAGRIKNTPKDFQAYMFKEKIQNKLRRRPTDWSDISPRRPADVDADTLGQTIYAQQWEGISNEIDYSYSKVSKVDFTPKIKSQNGNTVPEWVGTPIVRNAEQFLKDNPGKDLSLFPLTKWDGDYWVPKIRTRWKTVDGKRVKVGSYVALDRWVNRKKFDTLGKAERRRKTIEQSQGVPSGTRAKEKLKQLNAFNVKRANIGLRPLNMNEVDIDHVNALEAYDMYTKGLPENLKDEFKALLANEALTTGDNVGNLKIREKSIHKNLWPLLKARLKALGHKYKSYQHSSPQARMKYYKSINPLTGETRIAEFAEAIHFIDEKGSHLMEDLLIVTDQPPTPKGFPKIQLQKSNKDLLIELFGKGDIEEGRAAYRRFMDDLRDVPDNVKEEFILEALKGY